MRSHTSPPPVDDAALAERLTRAARAAQELCEVLWEALNDELCDQSEIVLTAAEGIGPTQRVAELSERLAYVSSTLTVLASAGTRGHMAPEPRTRVRESAAVLVDEMVSEAPRETVSETPPQIEIRDARGEGEEEGPAAWLCLIERQLERYGEDELPFTVLLVEPLDVGRLRHAESPSGMAGLAGQVEVALSEEMGSVDTIMRESPGRYWLLVPETDEIGARMLAERLTRAVRLSVSHRGAPLEVMVGIAVCPEHGREAAALAAHADVALYAARAAGRSMTPVDDQAC